MSPAATVRTGTLVGVEAIPVQVEVDIGPGIPGFSIVGLPDASVQEARERVRSALRAQGYSVPNARIVVNLAPGPLRKSGSGFDLPIASAILLATRQIPSTVVGGSLLVGELSLSGEVRPVPGILAYGLAARESAHDLLSAQPHEGDLGLVGLEHRCIASLADLKNERYADPTSARSLMGSDAPSVDFGQVAGHELPKRALMLAAAGDLGLLMVGPPGSGKTMLARRLSTILPPLSDADRLETALIHSVAGLDTTRIAFGERPFRAPHHSASTAGLVGGGSPPRPGEISLAHNGVLFLDEVPEFAPSVLQALRQPLEDGEVTLVRAEGRIRYPAAFTLIAAANPCPCGFLGDPERPCTCAPERALRYRSRIGGPLMDRIDMVVDVARQDPRHVLSPKGSVESTTLSALVERARERAGRRGVPVRSMTAAQVVRSGRIDGPTERHLLRLGKGLRLTGRGMTRLLRVARVVADVEDSDAITVDHLTEAAGYRAREV